MRRLALILPLLAGCNLEPHYVRPIPATPAALPAEAVPVPPFGYRDAFRDAALQAVIARGIAGNQDLKVALANVRIARGQYRIQRAARLPQIGGDAGVTVRNGGGTSSRVGGDLGTGTDTGDTGTGGTGTGGTGTGGTGTTTTGSNGGLRSVYSASIGASFELDLFGRLRNLSDAALDEYLATEAGVRAVRLTLIGDIATAWATLATDRSLLAIAADTRRSAADSVRLTRLRLDGGVAPRTELRQAETVLLQAEADQADLTAQVQEDRNALELLVGGPVADAELPPSIEAVDAALFPPPAGIDSRVLLRRPDVVQAEYRLRSANAGIGAARASFFPSIGLSGAVGLASTALTGLFSGGAFTWSAGPALSLPIFDGGARRGNLEAARGQFDLSVANYQIAIQQAFRDVADAFARARIVDAQVGAQSRLEAAAADTLNLSQARYREGIDAYLQTLDAQRTFYTARRSLAQARLVRATNRVDLYRALGGDELTDLIPRPAGKAAAAPSR